MSERDYERRWWTLGVLCLSLVMIVVANASLNVALPTLVKDLHAGASGGDFVGHVDRARELSGYGVDQRQRDVDLLAVRGQRRDRADGRGADGAGVSGAEDQPEAGGRCYSR